MHKPKIDSLLAVSLFCNKLVTKGISLKWAQKRGLPCTEAFIRRRKLSKNLHTTWNTSYQNSKMSSMIWFFSIPGPMIYKSSKVSLTIFTNFLVRLFNDIFCEFGKNLANSHWIETESFCAFFETSYIRILG